MMSFSTSDRAYQLREKSEDIEIMLPDETVKTRKQKLSGVTSLVR